MSVHSGAIVTPGRSAAVNADCCWNQLCGDALTPGMPASSAAGRDAAPTTPGMTTPTGRPIPRPRSLRVAAASSRSLPSHAWKSVSVQDVSLTCSACGSDSRPSCDVLMFARRRGVLGRQCRRRGGPFVSRQFQGPHSRSVSSPTRPPYSNARRFADGGGLVIGVLGLAGHRADLCLRALRDSQGYCDPGFYTAAELNNCS